MNVQNQIPRTPGVADTTDSPERLFASDCSASVRGIIPTCNGSENELRHAHQGIGQSSPTESDCILRLRRMWGGLLCGPKHVDPMWPEYLGKTFQPNIHLEECRSAIRLWDEAGRPDPKSWLDQMEAVNSQETNRGIRVLRKSYSSWVECAGKPNVQDQIPRTQESEQAERSPERLSASVCSASLSAREFILAAGLGDSENAELERYTSELRKLGWFDEEPIFPKFSTLLAGRECKEQARRMDKTEALGSLFEHLYAQWQSLGCPEVEWPESAFQSTGQSNHQCFLDSSSCNVASNVEPNDQAHRHGDTTSSPEEKVCPLEKGIKEVHDAVFGAAPCSGSLEEKTYSWDGFPVPFHECYFCTGDIIGIGSFKNAISAYHPKSGNFYIIAAAGWELTVEELDTTEEVKQALFHSFCQCPSGSIKENPMSGIHCARRKLPPREAEYFLSLSHSTRHSENRDER